jgi:hypothetical protein
MRFNPLIAVTLNTSTDLSDDIIEADVKIPVTHAVPSFKYVFDNRGGKYTPDGTDDTINEWDRIALAIETETQLVGQVDRSVAGISKDGGEIITAYGRGKAGPLEDIIDTLHYNNLSVMDVATDLIEKYNGRKGADDPVLAITSNLLPDPLPVIEWAWEAKSYWSMLKEICYAMAAPYNQGGVNTYYDVYVDDTGLIYIEPCGYRSSGITLTTGDEIISGEYDRDATAVKNDIWAEGASNAGAIPLTMQFDYPLGTLRTDPWTEGNAADWEGVDNVNSITDDAVTYVIGSNSIHIVSDNVWVGELIKWKMEFPFPPQGPPTNYSERGALWPGLDGDGNFLPYLGPYGHLNCYGTNGLSENMGQINALAFFLQFIIDAPYNTVKFRVEAIDGTSSRDPSDPTYQAQSNIARLDHPTPVYKVGATEISGGTFPNWNYVSIPFGPSVNLHDQPGSEKFDWSDVIQINFCMNLEGYVGFGTPEFWFDGFHFVKPLFANVTSDYVAHRDVRKSAFYRSTDLGKYPVLYLWAKGILLNFECPQVSVDLTNVGLTGLPSGQTFVLDGSTYVLRDKRIRLSKKDGWTIGGKGYAAI